MLISNIPFHFISFDSQSLVLRMQIDRVPIQIETAKVSTFVSSVIINQHFVCEFSDNANCQMVGPFIDRSLGITHTRLQNDIGNFRISVYRSVGRKTIDRSTVSNMIFSSFGGLIWKMCVLNIHIWHDYWLTTWLIIWFFWSISILVRGH